MKSIILFLFLFSLSANAQQPKTEFYKTLDSINAIVKTNKQVYFIDSRRSGVYVKGFKANENGVVTIIDSIVAKDKTITKNTEALLPDCCPVKTTKTLNLFEIKKWDVHFPYTKLKDKNNKVYGELYGIRQKDLFILENLFKKLTALCRKPQIETKF